MRKIVCAHGNTLVEEFSNISFMLNFLFSNAVRVDNTVYLSGSIGLDPKTNELVPGGVKEETHQALRNLGGKPKILFYIYSTE